MSESRVLENDVNISSRSSAVGLSPTRLGIQRLRQDRLAVVGLVLLCFSSLSLFSPQSWYSF